jgi:hypothetical protein
LSDPSLAAETYFLRWSSAAPACPFEAPYEPEPDGLRAMTALVVLREKVIKPLLAPRQHPEESHAKPNHPTPVDQHYEHLRAGMRDLFTALGMVA